MVGWLLALRRDLRAAMPFSSSPRNDRRRRVIRESIAADSDFAVESARAQRRARRTPVEEESKTISTGYRDPGYSQSVRRTCQQRMVQLIPIRTGALTITLGVMWSMWALLLVCHYWFHVRGNPAGRSPILILQLLDLRSPHSIANWMTSQLWALTAIVAWTIYRIRQHKLDDYRAKYRIWILLTLVAVFSSFDGSTSALYLLGQTIDGWTRREIGYGGWPLILAAYASLVALLGVRLSSELKATPTAVVLWFGGLLAWASAALIGTGLLKLQWNVGTIDMVVGGCWLGGVLAVFQAAGMFLRHCYIHAQKRFLERSVMGSGGFAIRMPSMPWSRTRDEDSLDPRVSVRSKNGKEEDENVLDSVPMQRDGSDDRKRSKWMFWRNRAATADGQDVDDDEDERSVPAQKSKTKHAPTAKVDDGSTDTKRRNRMLGWLPSRTEINEELIDEPLSEDDGEAIDIGLTKKPGWFGLGGNREAVPAVTPSGVTSKAQKSAPLARTAPATQSGTEHSSESKTSATRRWIPTLRRAKPSGEMEASGHKSTDAKSLEAKPKPVTPTAKPAVATSKTTATESEKPKSRWTSMLGAAKLSGWFDGLKLKPPVETNSSGKPQPVVNKSPSANQSSSVTQAPKPISNSNAPLPSTKPANTSWQQPSANDDDDDASDSRPLSKAERKRMRRQQGNDRNAA